MRHDGGRSARRQHHRQPAVRPGAAVRRQIGLGQHGRDARLADTGPAGGPRRAKLHGELEDLRTGLELGRGPRMSGVLGRPAGGGGRPTRFPFARRTQPGVRLATGHLVLLALSRPELQQLFQKVVGAHGPAALAAQVHRHGTDVDWRGK